MAKDDWQTPKELFSKLDEEFGFILDVACTFKNSLCECGIYVETESALDTDWWIWKYSDSDLYRTNEITCWMNPPYSRNNIAMFCKKALEESQKGCTVVGLIKLDTSTMWFQNYIMDKAHEVRFCKKRISFIDPDTGKKGGSPPFASAIIVWKPGIPEETKFSMYEW
jgi:site-specific DNA-methyltransferase (adenine-specific)